MRDIIWQNLEMCHIPQERKKTLTIIKKQTVILAMGGMTQIEGNNMAESGNVPYSPGENVRLLGSFLGIFQGIPTKSY